MEYRILIADDVEMNRILIIDILSRKLENAVFVEATNGKEVMDTVASQDIDLIVLDLIMPVMDGFQVLKSMKSNEETADIPIIVSSAITEISSIELTLKAGAMDYFTKPLSPNDMEIILPLKAKNALLFYEQQKTIAALNREITEELKNAHDFQSIMLPKSRDFENMDLFIKYQPSLGIGGDCFDCFEHEGKMWFIIADVTGHGIAAGMASSMVKILFRWAASQEGMTPGKVLESINHRIFEIFDFDSMSNYLVFTAFVGAIDDGNLQYANAGQPYPMIYHQASNEVEIIEDGGLACGMLDGIRFDDKGRQLLPGDSIFLYTDGLFSSGQKKDFVNWKLVHEYVADHRHQIGEDPDAFMEGLFWYFHFIHKGEDKNHEHDFTDDVAMMLLKVRPKE